MSEVTITKAEPGAKPNEDELKAALEKEGFTTYHWSNEPAVVYGNHTHDYHKVIYVLDGSIIYTVPQREGVDNAYELKVGDRMDMSPGVEHHTLVGKDGVLCLEGQKK